ncbi:MFS transporter, partial [Deinococcus pimensis]|uniref:MFS transporter n=1 Tax=Deinococcus pimensis TaxID=309888 RepID=UPI0012FB859E
MTTGGRLWNRDFVLWWVGTAQSSLGTALSGIALSFLVLEQTGSAGAMGVNLALSMLPGLLSPLAGTLVDRVPLRLPLVAGNAVRAALMLGVGLVALAGPVPLFALYGLSLLMGLIGVLYQPASGALVPTLVPQEHLARAMGLITTAAQSMSLVGLLAGGVMVSRFGSAPSLVVDGVSFLVMTVLLPFVRMPARAASAARR